MQTLVHHTIPHHHVHNETQGHKLHGHFDHFHQNVPGSHHGSRRPSNSSNNPKPKPAASSNPAVASFDISIIHQSLHTLGKHPLTLGFTFLGLNLHHRNITDETMYLLADYDNVMYIDVSANSISDLSVFKKFKCLTQFNACGNEITECLDFSPEKCDSNCKWAGGQQAIGSMLTLANMCQNKIVCIRDLSDHPFLECLLLKRNLIERITGLHSLKNLKVLDLSHNKLSSIEGLDGLNIEELNLEGNNITELTGLHALPRLSNLNAAHNLITSLAPLALSTTLLHINLQENRIAMIRQVEHLRDIPWLKVLELAGNPCFSKPFFRERVIFRLPNLGKLDMTPISADERIRSYNLYESPGGDIDNRTFVFTSVFPQSQFVNSGPVLQDEELDSDLS